jgi:hypothetical protein
MIRTVAVVALACFVLSGCETREPDGPLRTVQPPNPDRQFIGEYEKRRPLNDVSTDAQVLALGRLICRKLSENVHLDDLVKTLTFDKDGAPTGMSIRHAGELLGAAVANLCPDQKAKLNG